MHKMTIRPAQLLLGAITLAFSMGVQADTTLYATGASWFSNEGEHIQFSDNYAVGGGQDGYTRNNYFLFDLSGLSGLITSATLRVYNPNASVSPGFPYGYTSSDPTETYAMFDVSTPVADLVAGYGVGSLTGQAIFSDLGSGQNFGMYTASLVDNGKFVEISLNASGLNALNAAHGMFAVGGTITTLDMLVNKESLFASGYLSSVAPNVPQLVISSVPEPTESMLFIAGLGMLGLAARRRAMRTRLSCASSNSKCNFE
jgi:hypothetical protein